MMIHEFTRRAAAIAILSLAVRITAAAPAHAADAIPAKPEAGTFKLGIEPWLGYGQWHIAAKQGAIRQGAWARATFRLSTSPRTKTSTRRWPAARSTAANIATHTAMGMVAAGLPIKILMLLDFSLKADAIISRQTSTPSPI